MKLLRLFLFKLLALLLPKKEQVVVISGGKIEDNATEMANYIARNYDLTVYFITSKAYTNIVKGFLESAIIVYPIFSKRELKWKTLKAMFSSKYIFYTDRVHIFQPYRQTTINLWHGVGHKKIGTLIGGDPIRASLTIATSPMTKPMFAELFGVPEETVTTDGLPRNDLLLRGQKNSIKLRQRLPQEITDYSKMILWMPTFRRAGAIKNGQKQIFRETDNIFCLPDFDVGRFDHLLNKSNAVCLVKPHYYVTAGQTLGQYNNIIPIDNFWPYQHGLTLYELMACTDALITDYSSAMIDYSLLDQPVFCVAIDLEQYKQDQGLYFDDYESWVPTEFLQSQELFFEALEQFLTVGADPHAEKRKKIRDVYFQFQDGESARRIAERVFEKKG